MPAEMWMFILQVLAGIMMPARTCRMNIHISAGISASSSVAPAYLVGCHRAPPRGPSRCLEIQTVS